MQELELLPLAPSPEVFDAAVSLVDHGALLVLGRTADAELLFGEVSGSAARPYQVAAALVGDRPATRCTCPSRKFPCKHALALLVAWARDSGRFEEGAPPEEAAQLKERALARAGKGGEAETAEPAPKAKRPKSPNKAAQAKKAEAQLQGLDHAERLLLELSSAGLGTLDSGRVAALRDRAKELADLNLPGLALAVRRLASQLEGEAPVEQRHARAARHLAQLWTMIQKGRAMLSEKLEGAGAEQDDADAVIEELLGKVWQLSELKERGHVRTCRLLELAYERVDDPDREERIETSYLLDLEDGAIHREIAFTPDRRVKQTPPKPSHAGVLTVSECVVYPGFANRRVRWEADRQREAPLSGEDLAAVLARAVPIQDAVSRAQAQLKNLLAPSELVVLVAVEGARTRGEDCWATDASGAAVRLLEQDPERPVLALTGWPESAGALLGRLSLDVARSELVMTPLSLVTPSSIIRISL